MLTGKTVSKYFMTGCNVTYAKFSFSSSEAATKVILKTGVLKIDKRLEKCLRRAPF